MDNDANKGKAETNQLFFEVIHSYSRSQAIEDGVLVDVSEVARKIGYRIPVALTVGVWSDCIAWQDTGHIASAQNDSQHLWDLLRLVMIAARSAANESRVDFQTQVASPDGRVQLVKLRLVIDSGDTGEPVITLMLQSED